MSPTYINLLVIREKLVSEQKDLTASVSKRLSQTTNLYFVEAEFNRRCYGGNPHNQEVFRTHIEVSLRREAKAAAKRGDTPPSEERIQEIVEHRMKEMFGEDMSTTVENESEKMHSGFKFNESGPYIETRQVKAMMRDTMTRLGISMEKRGTKSTLKGLVTLIACDPSGEPLDKDVSNQINFWRDSENENEVEVVSSPDGTHEMIVQATTPQGPITAIKWHDYVENVRIFFLIEVPANLPSNRSTAILRDEQITMILGHAGRAGGLGACHSAGEGRFTVASLQRLTDVPYVQKSKAAK